MASPSRWFLILSIVSLFLTGAASAAPASGPRTRREPVSPVRSGASSAERGKALSAFVDVIVQFREPAAARTRTAAVASYMAPEHLAARGVAVRQRVADLGRDLERLKAMRSSAVTDAAESEVPRIRRTFSRVLFGASARVRRDMLPALAALPYVASVHVERTFRTSLVNSVPQIGASEVWATHGARGQGVVVAVLDSGIDYLHPALGGGFGAGFKVAGGWDLVNDDADPLDDNGHGTHVAGIIAANGGGLTGVAPEATLLAYKVFDPDGQGSESNMIAAIERVVDPDQNGDPSDHVDIVNISGGATAAENDPTALAVENATAAGVLFCIATGNTGDWGNVGTPAIASSVIAVGASDRNDRVAVFSARGPSYDFTIKPDVVAPGTDIVSSVLKGETAAVSGTSMAAPHVSGLAALLKSLHDGWSPAELKSAIVTGAVPLESDVMAAGAGRVDALRAATLETLAEPPVVSFGQIDGQAKVWTASRTFTLRNITGAPQTLTASVAGAREGVSVRITPESVTLAAGESRSVTAQISVTNSAVPAPHAGSLSFGGRIVWSGGAVPIQLPWAFVKGAFLTIDAVGNENPVYAEILGARTSYGTYEFESSARFFWPMEKVDVALTEFPRRNAALRIGFAEEVDIASGAHAVVDFAQSKYTFALDATDDTGAPLVQEGRECWDEIIFSFAGTRKVPFEQYPGLAAARVNFNSVSQRGTVYLASRCADVERNALFLAMHEPQHGLSDHVVRTTRPRWLRQDVRFGAEAGSPEGMTVALAVMHFPGSAFVDGGWNHLMRGTSSDFKLFYTPSTAPEVGVVAMLERWGECPAGGDCPMFDNIYLYVDEERVAAQGDLYTELSPMAYRVPQGTPLTFGGMPVSPQVGFDAIPGLWATSAEWVGSLSERRFNDTASARIAVYDASGALVAEGKAGLTVQQTLPPAPYRIESIDTSYSIAGRPGKATFIGWADTSKRHRDSLLPVFFGLRIVDGEERPVEKVARDGRASLLFSVGDVRREPGNPYLSVVPPREDATLVEYRAHGSTDWRPLPALIVARHYKNNGVLNGGTGTMYRADLTAVLGQVGGLVDLRLRMQDEEGNSGELLLEPAFFSGATGRRRSVGH